jgi:hypothetical protein
MYDSAVRNEVHFEQSDTLPEESFRNRGFLGRRSERVQLGQTAALYCRVSTADQTWALRRPNVSPPSVMKRICRTVVNSAPMGHFHFLKCGTFISTDGCDVLEYASANRDLIPDDPASRLEMKLGR